MQIRIDNADEWYPVCTLGNATDSEVFGRLCEVPEATVARWKETFEAFHKVQEELKAYHQHAMK